MKKICLLFSLIAVFSACSSKKKEAAVVTNDVIPVSVISLQQESISRPIQASGVFTTEDETYLGFKIGGVIQHVFVKEGDAVRQGQPIGRIGHTGRATGPHLHWSIKWRDSRLDPILLLRDMVSTATR